MSTPAVANAYNEFLRWYTKPVEERNPQTQIELCEILHISDSDIAEYQKRDTFYDDLYSEARNWGRSKIPQLLHSLVKEFERTKKAATLDTFKKLLEIDKKEGGATINFNVLNPTDQQYRQIVTREARLLTNISEEPSAEFLPAN